MFSLHTFSHVLVAAVKTFHHITHIPLNLRITYCTFIEDEENFLHDHVIKEAKKKVRKKNRKKLHQDSGRWGLVFHSIA
jgi:hypothetical protein